jgi:hypothetical protein
MISHNVHSQLAAVEWGDNKNPLDILHQSRWVMDCAETHIFKALSDTIDRTQVLVHRSLPLLYGFQLSDLICPI